MCIRNGNKSTDATLKAQSDRKTHYIASAKFHLQSYLKDQNLVVVKWQTLNMQSRVKVRSILVTLYIHYAPLMMSQEESPRNHPWVIPRKVDKWFEFPLNLALKKMMGASYYKTGHVSTYWKKKWWVIPGWFLLLLGRAGLLLIGTIIKKSMSNPTLPSSRNHPGITHCFLLPISSI